MGRPSRSRNKGRGSGSTWSRGGVKLVGAAVVAAFAVCALGVGASDWWEDRPMASASLCDADVSARAALTRDCFFPVVGRLESRGREYRSVQETWRLVTPELDLSDSIVEVDPRQSRRLDDLVGDEVMGLLWHGHLVAFSPTTVVAHAAARPSGSNARSGPIAESIEVIPAFAWGGTADVTVLLSSVVLGGWAWALRSAARRQARRNGGWWVAGETVRLRDLPVPPRSRGGRLAFGLSIVSAIAAFAIALGASMPLALVIGVALPSAVVLAIWLRLRLSPGDWTGYRGKHEREPE